MQQADTPFIIELYCHGFPANTGTPALSVITMRQGLSF